jgi:nucleolar protein 6
LQPFTVRHSTDKSNQKKSKGFAFLEFQSYDRMKTCLKLYHHSMFDPDNTTIPQNSSSSKARTKHNTNGTQDKAQEDDKGNTTKKGKTSKTSNEDESLLGPPLPSIRKSKNSRRINVELTAGGGGKSEARKSKIQQKNQKLAEQRERMHAKKTEERNSSDSKKQEDLPVKGGEAGAGRGEGTREEEQGQIHPSRLKRMRI